MSKPSQVSRDQLTDEEWADLGEFFRLERYLVEKYKDKSNPPESQADRPPD